MEIAKAEVLKWVDEMPDSFDIEELRYRLDLRQKIEAAREDVRAGRPRTQNETASARASRIPDNIRAAIEQSRDLYGLEDDWDDAGSQGYSRETWERAAEFLRLHAMGVSRELGGKIPTPVIGPGPHGSIDIHWKEDTFELLVNVPANPTQPASFYGDDYGNQVIEGTVATSEYKRGILHWLIRN